jgi:WD40 repeat protein
MSRFQRISPLLLAVFFTAGLLASSPAAPEQATTSEAMRLLKSNCFSCHNGVKKKGGLVMTSREGLLKGGENGAALDLESPEKSALLEALAAGADPHMPPKKQLAPPQIDALKRWVKEGAAWDAASLVNLPSAPRNPTLMPLPESYHPVLAVAVSPDSKRLAVGCGNELVIFDLATPVPTQVARASAHADPIQSIAWAPDNARLVTGGFRRAVIWNAESLTAEKTITEGLTDRVVALRFLPGGKQFVIADGRVAEIGTIRIADLESGTVTASWQAHSDTIFDLSVSSDGKLLATAGGDKLVKIWDLETHQEIAKLEGHTAQVLALAFDPKNAQLVTGGVDEQLKVWDVKTREKINSLGTHTAAITALAWSPAGPTVIAANEAGAVLRYTDLKSHTGAQTSAAAKESKLESAGTTLLCLAATAKGDQVFAGSQDGRLFAWKDAKLAATIAVNEKPATPGPSFVRDVLPVLAKAGCNAGSCHAKPEGQNGFKLTVFSYDPKADFHKIVEDARGRRIFPAAPEESLILLKATETIPHEGGERFAKDSAAYKTLLEWIRGGMLYQAEGEPELQRLTVTPAEQVYKKGASQQLRVEAAYSDGSTRDVTSLAGFVSNDKEIAKVSEDGQVAIGQLSGQAVIVARFMGLVGDARITVPADRLLPEAEYAALPVNNFIDELAYAQFKRLGLFPSQPCTDSEFLRRASLDVIGALPSPEEARAFLADTDPQKREKLIDRLLAHPYYGDFWANKWADLLRPNPDRAGIKSVYVLNEWLRATFAANTPYDQFVRDIVLTEGDTHKVGPAVIYRDRREPQDMTTMFSQLFLGVRLDCAKCHHHPNEKWGQDDFYKMAAFFGPLKHRGDGISAPISGGHEVFYFEPGRTVKHPVTGELLKPQAPDGPPLTVSDDTDPRRALADWLTDPQNPFFARAIANRVWAAFFGRGIVDPVDDFRISNPPSNPALLDALGQEMIRDKFDLKAFMRTVMRSHLYQLSALPNDSNRADTRNFSRAYRRRLSAETITDALADITAVRDTFTGLPPGSRAVQAWTYKTDSLTMDAFGRPNSSTDCPCERDMKPSIVQSLHLMNSSLLQNKLASKAGRIERLVASDLEPEQIVAEAYLACYSRLPQEEEVKRATAAFTAEGATRRSATEDVFWSLLNSAEFVFNH